MENKIDDKPDTGAKTPCHGNRLSFWIYLYWYVIGNIFLAIFAFLIVFAGPKWFALSACLYCVSTLSLVLVRYLDVRFFKGLTSTEEPATMVHWIKYSRNLFIIATILLLIAFKCRLFLS